MFRVIDFYSYKGGAGRSVTTFNTLPFIAESLGATAEKPLIVFDMDLDSAGITYLVGEDDTYSKKGGNDIKDVGDYFDDEIDILRTFTSKEDCDLLKNSVDISRKVGYPIEESILFIGLDDFDILKEFANPINLDRKLKKLKTYFKKYAAGLVFDSASGGQAISQALLRHSDEVVVCLKVTDQFRQGTIRYLKKLLFDSTDFKESRITLLPVAISKNETMANEVFTFKELALNDLVDHVEGFEKRIKKENKNIRFNKIFLDEKNFGIPEIESFKWKEKNLAFESLNDKTLEPDEEIGFERFQLLGKELSTVED